MVDLTQPTLASSVPGKEGANAPRALISVYDKTGVTAFATTLTAMGWQILSTGGTARLLRENGVNVTDVTDVTGHPEVFDGRVKTLHPAIHARLRRQNVGSSGNRGGRTRFCIRRNRERLDAWHRFTQTRTGISPIRRRRSSGVGGGLAAPDAEPVGVAVFCD